MMMVKDVLNINMLQRQRCVRAQMRRQVLAIVVSGP